MLTSCPSFQQSKVDVSWAAGTWNSRAEDVFVGVGIWLRFSMGTSDSPFYKPLEVLMTWSMDYLDRLKGPVKIDHTHINTSIAARGGGGSFKRLKLYNSEEHLPIESFVTTLIHWTFFSDDANQVGICWLCRSGQLHVTPSSRWSLPRCHRSVRNDMRLFLRTKQYPVQLRTTKFWKVLPQYYSVLQSTTPVLLRTTKYYKVLVQYYSVLQSTTPVLLRTTKY